MRVMMISLFCSILSMTSAAQGNIDSNAEYLNAETNNEILQQQWNRWVCEARARGYFRPFYGASYYFRAGSGEGQQARTLAHLSALRRCQFQTGQQCFSRLETDCYVQRF